MIARFIKNIPFAYTVGLKLKHWNWNNGTKKEFKKYLANFKVPKLQLGAGMNELPGWFNTDYFARPAISFLDVTKPFSFPDDTFEWIFSEHHIEHIQYKQARFMLSEIYRVMKPGGHLKINTPDLDKYLFNYTENKLKAPVIEKHVDGWIYQGFAYAENYIPVDKNYEAHFINDIFLNYEHRFIYNANSLRSILQEAGFINIIQRSSTGNEPVEFQNIEAHLTEFDKLFTLYMQAQKPVK